MLEKKSQIQINVGATPYSYFDRPTLFPELRGHISSCKIYLSRLLPISQTAFYFISIKTAAQYNVNRLIHYQEGGVNYLD